MTEKKPSPEIEAALRVLRRKLTKEPGKQPTVVIDSDYLETDDGSKTLGLYEPKLNRITLEEKSAPNVVAHELQHSIDAEQTKKAKAAGVYLGPREDRPRRGHTPDSNQLMSTHLWPENPKDEQLAKEARGNLDARQKILDQETKNWLTSKVGVVGKLPFLKEIIQESATTMKDLRINPSEAIKDKPPVSFEQALQIELKRRKKK